MEQQNNDPIDPATIAEELNTRQTAVVKALIKADVPLSPKTAIALHVLGATVLLRMGMRLPVIIDPKELDAMMDELVNSILGGKTPSIN